MFCLVSPIGTPTKVEVIKAIRVYGCCWSLALLSTVLGRSTPDHLVECLVVTLSLVEGALVGLNGSVLFSGSLLEQLRLEHNFIFETLPLQLNLGFVEA